MTTLPDDTGPSAEALEAAREVTNRVLAGYRDDETFGDIWAEVALALDRFRAAGVREWQPIETAPRDGTEVLIGWFELPGQRSMHVAFWHRTHRAWCQTHQLFTNDPNWQPTHWMPLPEPPHDL